jgi:hypothetical protein
MILYNDTIMFSIVTYDMVTSNTVTRSSKLGIEQVRACMIHAYQAKPTNMDKWEEMHINNQI